MSSVNGKKTAKVRRVRENPLISTDLLDTAQQRLMVLAFFVLIQSFKVYDLIILKNSNITADDSTPVIKTMFLVSFQDNKLNFLFKYLIIDTVFLWVLPYFNIPYLNFNKVVTLFQILFMTFITLILLNQVNVPIFSSIFTVVSSFFKLRQKEITLLGDVINRKELLDHSQYFKGKKTIKFLPDSLVELNPFDQVWCMDNDLIQVPVKFNTSSDGLDFLQLKYISLENSETQLLNYTSKILKKMIKTGARTYYNEMSGQDGIFYIDLAVPESGYYQIVQVIDNKSMNLKMKNKHLIIPQCPSAKLIQTSPRLGEMCLNEEIKADDLVLNAIGLPPLTVKYNVEVNGQVIKSPSKKIVPYNFTSPLTSSKKVTNLDIAQLHSWAGTRSVTSPVLEDKKLEKAGDYIYTITSIEDALGNTVIYDEPSVDNELLFKFITHNVPEGTLVDYSSSRPLLEGKSKKLNIQLHGISCQKCDSPYVASINHYDESDQFVKTFNQTFDIARARDLSFAVTEPGYYELNSFASKYCAGSKSNKIHVPFVELPKIDINAESIVDACVGTTGFTFNFNVTGGTPPFRLEYQVHRLKNNRLTSIPQVKMIEAKTHLFKHDYKPSIEGNYSIEFTKVRDQYYDQRFESGKYKYITYFKRSSTASVGLSSADVCYGNSQSFPVIFDGKPPFTLEYNLLKDGHVIGNVKKENITSTEFQITTEKLTNSGLYLIQLLNAEDSSNCNVEIKNKMVSFKVRESQSKLSFAKLHESYEIVEGGEKSIPIKYENLNGKFVDLIYKLTNANGEESVRTLHNFNPRDGFKISEKGSYNLISFNDNGCPGIVTGNTISVEYYAKPKIELLTQAAPAVCVDKKQNFKFKLTGEPPFTVEYSIHHPNQEVENKFAHVAGHDFTLDAVTANSGDYKYVITGIQDSLYSGDIFESLERRGLYKFQNIEIGHKVWDTPSALFTNSSTVKTMQSNQNMFIQTCLSNLNDETLLEALPIKLFGQPPFNLKMDITSKSGDFHKKFELSNIETTSVNSYEVYRKFKLGTGNYVVSLLEIVDGHGCVNKQLKEQSNSIMLKINDVPKIKRHINRFHEHNKIDPVKFAKHSVNKGQKYDDYYCVGDHFYFQLEGLPPFNVVYNFNNESHTISNLHTPNFKRLATKPGVMSVESISDFSAKNCVVDLTQNAEKVKVYGLPSVEISQGNIIEEDIHAGDQAELSFTLSGIPPFKLSYTRTTIDDGYDSKKKRKGKKYGDKIVETEVIENIMGYEYSIWTSLDGTYEAVEIEDSRCRVRNNV